MQESKFQKDNYSLGSLVSQEVFKPHILSTGQVDQNLILFTINTCFISLVSHFSCIKGFHSLAALAYQPWVVKCVFVFYFSSRDCSTQWEFDLVYIDSSQGANPIIIPPETLVKLIFQTKFVIMKQNYSFGVNTSY